MTNVITFEGNLATDPQLTYTSRTATPVVELVVLVNRSAKDEAGQWVDAEPTRYRVKAYRHLAEHTAELERGCTVLVHGYVKTETLTDTQTGDKRTADIVTAEAIGASLRFTTVTIAKTPSTPERGSVTPVEEPLMTAAAAATLLQVDATQLARWRSAGTGPPWIRVTNRCIRYRPSDVQAWRPRHGDDQAAKSGSPDVVLV